MLFAPFFLLLAIAAGPSTESEVIGLPLTGDEAVEFLHTAKVLGRPERFDSVGDHRSVRVTLTDGTRTLRAVFKDEDTNHMIFHFADGKVLTGVKDSYRHEIAAYELDVLLKLGIVPPCVKRSIRGDIGSLCIWVENAMTEAARQRKKISRRTSTTGTVRCSRFVSSTSSSGIRTSTTSATSWWTPTSSSTRWTRP